MGDQHLRPGPGESALPGTLEVMQPEGPSNPWQQRRELGWLKALYQTSKLFLLDPVQGFAVTRIWGGFRGPLLYALLISFVATFLAELFDAVFQIALDPEGSGNLGDLLDVEIQGERVKGIEWLPASLLGAASFAGCVVGLLVGIPVFSIMFPLVMLVWTGVLHLCLKLTGGLRNSAAGYQGTWIAVCYATTAFIPGVIPVIGPWLSFFWLGLLQGIGFWRLHRTTPIRAAVALLLPFTIPAALWLLKWAGLFPIASGAGP